MIGMLWGGQAGMAADFSFIGTLNYDTDVQFFNFTVSAATPTPTLRTYSYAGGVNGVGATIAAGGFDPILNLYMADGTQMNPGTPGGYPNGTCAGAILPTDAVTGVCGDVYYPTTLSFPGGVWAPGTYILALTINANAGLGNLPDGFFGTGVLGLAAPANFSCGPGYSAPPGTPDTNPFCDDISVAQRNGSWALDISGVSAAAELSAATPEPGTLSLALLSAAALAVRRKRSASRLRTRTL